MSTLQDRYGRRQRPRWFWPLVATVGIALGVAWAAWLAFQDRPVTGEVFGYDVVSDQATVVTIDVYRPEPVAVSCTVYVQSESATIVGERTVDLSPGTARTTRVEVEVETEQRAVTGVLRGCVPSD